MDGLLVEYSYILKDPVSFFEDKLQNTSGDKEPKIKT